MSYTEMFAADREGDVSSFATFTNAHGGAMAVWRLLAERYLQAEGMAFMNLMLQGYRPVFDLAKEGKLEPWEFVTLMTTCDRVFIPIEHVASVASAMEEFHKHYRLKQEERGFVFSIGDQAADLRRMVEEVEERGWRGVGWNQTSVNGDCIFAGSYDEEQDENVPYNIDKQSDHWVWPENQADEDAAKAVGR